MLYMDGCFYTSAAELSSCAQAVWPSESNIYTLALFRKPLRSPTLNNESDAHLPVRFRQDGAAEMLCRKEKKQWIYKKIIV